MPGQAAGGCSTESSFRTRIQNVGRFVGLIGGMDWWGGFVGSPQIAFQHRSFSCLALGVGSISDHTYFNYILYTNQKLKKGRLVNCQPGVEKVLHEKESVKIFRPVSLGKRDEFEDFTPHTRSP